MRGTALPPGVKPPPAPGAPGAAAAAMLPPPPPGHPPPPHWTFSKRPPLVPPTQLPVGAGAAPSAPGVGAGGGPLYRNNSLSSQPFNNVRSNVFEVRDVTSTSTCFPTESATGEVLSLVCVKTFWSQDGGGGDTGKASSFARKAVEFFLFFFVTKAAAMCSEQCIKVSHFYKYLRVWFRQRKPATSFAHCTLYHAAEFAGLGRTCCTRSARTHSRCC